MTITYSMYNLTTGLFTGQSLTASADLAAQNTPGGCGLVVGMFDPLSKKVDLEATAAQAAGTPTAYTDPISGKTITLPAVTPSPVVVDYQPAAPANTASMTYAWNATTKRWVGTPTDAAALASAQTAQAAVVSAACATAITGGFQSSALGAAYTYPSGITDQANITASVVASLVPGLPSGWTTLQVCADSSGVWAYRAHTAAQIQQAGSDGKAAILANLTKNAGLQAQITAATTVVAVRAVTW